MTNSMLENAARALWNQKPDSKLHPWEGLGSIRDDYRDAARAVLLAIRVPDEAMLEAGRRASFEEFFTDMAWQACIDAILKEGA